MTVIKRNICAAFSIKVHKVIFALCFTALMSFGTQSYADPAQAQNRPVDLTKQTITICDDVAEWAPYTYFERNNGKKTKKLTGFSIDVIRHILSKNGIPFTFKMLPWKRCLAEVEKGTKFDMFVSASRNPERERKYYISDEPYYAVTPHYYWSKTHHPEGLDIKVPTDISKYKIGTVRGYANSLMKNLNVDLSNLDDGASDLKAVVKKLHAGRIDVFEEGWEVLSGMSLIGFYDFVNDLKLGRAPFPEAKNSSYHMMFTKQTSTGFALKKLFDREFMRMKASGELEAILKKYVQ